MTIVKKKRKVGRSRNRSAGGPSPAVLLHGSPSRDEYFDPVEPSPSNAHWFPWLQKELLMLGYDAQTPEMPAPYRPDYRAWRMTFERLALTKEALLVGHSCGGGFLLRWLCENRIKVKRTLLVAPWINPGSLRCVPGFFDFRWDTNLTTRTELHVLYSDNDSEEVNESVRQILHRVPGVHRHRMPDAQHFCTTDFKSAECVAIKQIVLGFHQRR